MAAFAVRDLSVIAYVTGWTSFCYITDAPFETLEPGFFNDAAGMLSPGDMITIPNPDCGLIRFVRVQDGVVTLTVPA